MDKEKKSKDKSRPRRTGVWSRVLRVVACLLTAPLWLSFFLFILLYYPPFQQFACRELASYASQQTGMDISMRRVGISFPLDLDLQGFTAVQHGDTLASVQHVIVDLDLTQLCQMRAAVDALDLRQGMVNTADYIATTQVQGRVGNFHISTRDFEYGHNRLCIERARLDSSDVLVTMRDTTIVDTTESQLDWVIDVGELRIRSSHVAFSTVGDTLHLDTQVGGARVEEFHADLGQGLYDAGLVQLDSTALNLGYEDMDVMARVERLQVDSLQANTATSLYRTRLLFADFDTLGYSVRATPRTQGIDYNHLLFSRLHCCLENFCYDDSTSHLRGQLAGLSFHERSGLQVNELLADVELDSRSVDVSGLHLRTPYSRFDGQVQMDWTALSTRDCGPFAAQLRGYAGRHDVMLFARSQLPPSVVRLYPDQMLTAHVDVRGNMNNVDIRHCQVEMPRILSLVMEGRARNLLHPDRLQADLNLDFQGRDLSLVANFVDLPSGMRIPAFAVKGSAQVRGPQYVTDLMLNEGQGHAHLQASFNSHTEAYRAALDVHRINPRDVLTTLPIQPITAHATAEGHGLDPYSMATDLVAHLQIDDCQYTRYQLGGTQLDARLHQGQAHLSAHSRNGLVDADVQASASLLRRQLSKLDFNVDLRRINLLALGVVDFPLHASMQSHFDGWTNLSDRHYVSAQIRNMEMTYADSTYRPADADLEALVTPDSVGASLLTGDLELGLHGHGGYEKLLAQCQRLYEQVRKQADNLQLDQMAIKPYLPHLDAHIRCGQENVVSQLIARYGITFDSFHMDLQSHPVKGLNGDGELYALTRDSVTLDHAVWTLFQDTTGISADARLTNYPENPKLTFDARVRASLLDDGGSVRVTLQDDEEKTTLDMGAILARQDTGIQVRLYPHEMTLNYRRFDVNRDNYIYIGKNKRVEANVDLVADDKTALRLTSTPNEEALQDLSLAINHFNVGELCRSIPGLPNLGGMLQGDVHMVQTNEKEVTFMADLQVSDMTYERSPLGNLGANFLYLPNADGTHYVDGIVSRDGIDLAQVTGTYDPADGGTVMATADVLEMPLSMADGFTGGMARFDGRAGARIDIAGHVSDPQITGVVYTDSARIISDTYSLNLRIADDTLHVANSQILLDRIEGYTTTNNPLVLDGSINFANTSRIVLNLTANARNFQLINSGRTRNADAYGRVLVNLASTIRGTTDNIQVMGQLDVLEGTDVTYVLRDSPISSQDELEDLVTFVNFRDTVQVEDEEAPVAASNIRMNMGIHIADAAQVHCLLSEDRTNYVNLEGGGDLTMSYSARDGMQLYGRYTILSGDLKYSLLIVPLKNFTIASGSYVEFSGDLMNPRLNIQATENVTTTITDGQSPRSVGFDVGLSLTQTLENMGLEFTIDAPEDMSIQNELAQMTDAARGRVAVTMLATGMYITENNASGGLSTQNALNAFLQSEISNITGKALRSVDISFGLENGTSLVGTTTTDYSFRFAKRFWGNRISVIVGGRVSTGADAVNTGQSIIDNVSLEYRLDKGATRYVRLYYDRDNESLMEGRVIEMGAGLVMRRKTTRLGDLFLFRTAEQRAAAREKKRSRRKQRRQEEAIQEVTDSIQRDEEPLQ